MKRAHLACVVAAAVLAVAGCDNPFQDDRPPRESDPRATAPQNPGPNNPGPKNPTPKPTTPQPPTPKPTTPKPTTPEPWVQKGPATLTGCGKFARYANCTFTGTNFKPGEKINFLRDGFLLHVFTADKEGRFTQSPGSNPRVGPHTYTARGMDSGVEASTTVYVTEEAVR
ncbi:hypothetical protein [Streptomyces bambusae]|uniref:hypothetical protein n=1 Tax=Streptomyces bambusae TaxID=1550616 RepID=UPI001CA5B8AB|nr:hypothetical protein [Streptomyces bambusae]